MRRENHVGALKAWMDEWLIFINVESRTGNFLVFQSGDERGFIHDRAARCIDEKSGGLHAEELRRIEQSAGLREKRDVKADEIGFREERVHIAKFGVDGFFGVFGGAQCVRIDDLHLKPRGAASDSAADATKSDDAQRLAPNVGATELIEIPAFPVARASQSFAFAESAG